MCFEKHKASFDKAFKHIIIISIALLIIYVYMYIVFLLKVIRVLCNAKCVFKMISESFGFSMKVTLRCQPLKLLFSLLLYLS